MAITAGRLSQRTGHPQGKLWTQQPIRLTRATGQRTLLTALIQQAPKRATVRQAARTLRRRTPPSSPDPLGPSRVGTLRSPSLPLSPQTPPSRRGGTGEFGRPTARRRARHTAT